MSSSNSGWLSSVFAGVSVADIVRAASFARSRPVQNWPLEVAHAGHFAVQSQPATVHSDDAEPDGLETVRARMAA